MPEPEAHIVTGWMGGAVDRGRAGRDRVRPPRRGRVHLDHRRLGRGPVEPVTEWVRGVWRETERFSTGGVVRQRARRGRSVRDAYAEDIWQRLVEVKRRYDPDGVFAATGAAR